MKRCCLPIITLIGKGVVNIPDYRKYGKILTPLTDEEFKEGMRTGKFCSRKHKGYVTLLFYFGVRKTEGLRAKKGQFKVSRDLLYFDVGKRLKHGMLTPALNVRLDAPFVGEIAWAVEETEEGERVWPYSDKTGYNIVIAFSSIHIFSGSAG